MKNTPSPPRPIPLPLTKMARQLGIHPKDLRALAEANAVPSMRVGSSFMFDAEATKAAICAAAKTGGAK